MFLQLHLSEKTGRGVPMIIRAYSKDTISFRENTITVTIPFTRLNGMNDKTGERTDNKGLNATQRKILSEIRNNPNVTKPQLAINCGVSMATVDRIINVLKNRHHIKRIGSNKGGYWKVLTTD